MSNIYDNFPLNALKKTNREALHIPNIKSIQNTFKASTGVRDKRRNSPDIQRVIHKGNSRKSKSSRSISEILFKNHCEVNDNLSQQEEFGSNETLKAVNEDKPPGIAEEFKRNTNIQSTPTSGFDDGYESSNSTPLVSGKF